ncbi:hypothetical protein OB236_28445 [Paenibacillus sp. WQ 127069]|uniref:Uncharacterized protein n=1 Tax=Paenibacillus baimaensis TaxID=2982185 RepID=A0ABT2UPR7_9BACL|nr:hypothetical protein [Paenibacillus sp. WQ 127069]MCU6796056.1 hypothetical protein [Paenibacillus sp. WQ 127069]
MKKLGLNLRYSIDFSAIGYDCSMVDWFANNHSKQQVVAHPSFRVLPCFTWPFVGDPFGLTQPQVDDSPWLKPYCFTSRVFHGFLALESLPSVAKRNRRTWALAYPPKHSANRNPHGWNPPNIGGRGGIRSRSDGISYEENPVATGEEEKE